MLKNTDTEYEKEIFKYNRNLRFKTKNRLLVFLFPRIVCIMQEQ